MGNKTTFSCYELSNTCGPLLKVSIYYGDRLIANILAVVFAHNFTLCIYLHVVYF